MNKLLFILALGVSPAAFTHSGGTDAYGCHTNHQTGEYHCHNPKFQEKTESEVKVAAQTEKQKRVSAEAKK